MMGEAKPVRALLIQIFPRIDRKAVQAHFVVEVRSRAGAGVAGIGNNIAPPNALSGLHVEAGIMSIERLDAVAMADLDHVAVTRAETGLDHHAVGRGHDRRTRLCRNVHALMELLDAAEG